MTDIKIDLYLNLNYYKTVIYKTMTVSPYSILDTFCWSEYIIEDEPEDTDYTFNNSTDIANTVRNIEFHRTGDNRFDANDLKVIIDKDGLKLKRIKFFPKENKRKKEEENNIEDMNRFELMDI